MPGANDCFGCGIDCLWQKTVATVSVIANGTIIMKPSLKESQAAAVQQPALFQSRQVEGKFMGLCILDGLIALALRRRQFRVLGELIHLRSCWLQRERHGISGTQ
jgi:hypothetical protein